MEGFGTLLKSIVGITLVVLLVSVLILAGPGRASNASDQQRITELEGQVVFLETIVAEITNHLPRDARNRIRSRANMYSYRGGGDYSRILAHNKARSRFTDRIDTLR